jgi:hypothetical protein
MFSQYAERRPEAALQIHELVTAAGNGKSRLGRRYRIELLNFFVFEKNYLHSESRLIVAMENHTTERLTLAPREKQLDHESTKTRKDRQ